ncbi:MAG: hypothetical protein GY950_23640, partial [bacterium]|nr:hypothetical protein [bacterium]
KTVIVDTMGAEEVSGAIDVVWQDTGWVTKKVTPYEVTVVPTVTFKIKNTGKRPLEYVNFEGIFRIEETGNELGSGGALAFKEPLEPGVVSDEIVLKSNFGYTGRTKELILNNPEWKQIQVKIFARTKGSPAVAIGDPYPIKKMIERSAGGALETPAAEKEASLNAESFEKIGKTLQIVEFDSVWMDRLRSAHKAIIVPSVTFYVKNVGN